MPAPSRRRFLALASLATTATAAAPQEPTFSSSITLIRVDAEVLQDDRMIEGLTAQDFEVLDNGQPQPVRNLSRDHEPLDIVLLFDISGSMEWVAKKVATAAERALAALQPGDRAAVMTFHTWQDLVEPLTDEMPHIVEAVRLKVLRSRFGGGTHLTAAAGEAVKILATAEGGRRRAVIALTDNRGTASRREDRVLNEYWEADAILCGIITVQDPRQFAEWKSRQIGPQLAVPEQGLGNLILQTGGAAITTDEPGEALEDMLRRLRSRYTLYYSMPPTAQPGKARKTQVRLRGAAAQRYPNARIRARGGYLAPRPVE